MGLAIINILIVQDLFAQNEKGFIMSIHDFKVEAQDGSDISLADYKGKPDAEDCKAAAAFAKKIVS